MKKTSRGFTLIELLIVIAIIGILSSVVLSSLRTARSRGAIAAVQSELVNMRSQAELYYITNGNYGTATDCTGGMFNAAGGLQALISSINNKTTVSCYSNNTLWAVKTAAMDSIYYCADSTGTSTQRSADPDITDSAC